MHGPVQFQKRRPIRRIASLFGLNELLEIGSVVFAPSSGIFTVSNRGMELDEFYDFRFCLSGEMARTCFHSRVILTGIRVSCLHGAFLS